MKLPMEEVRRLCSDTLKKRDLSAAEIDMAVEMFVDAEIRNGIGLFMLWKMLSSLKAERNPIVVAKDNPVYALIDGGHNIGELTGPFAMNIAIEKAKNSGVGVVGVYNTEGFPLIGTLARKAAADHFVSLVFCNSLASVAPYGSADPAFGTNPLAIGFPSKEGPIVLDMATSSLILTQVRMKHQFGGTLPPGSAIDKHGLPTTDPVAVLEGGALLPFGDYKGSGLSCMIELLCGPLVNAKAGHTVPGTRGFLFIVLDPSIFFLPDVTYTDFVKRVSNFANGVRNLRPAQGFNAVRLPGDRSQQKYQQALQEGVEVSDEIYQKLISLLPERE